MTDRCTTPLSWETLVAYWAGDLPADEEERTELHLLGCATCTAESRRVAAVTEGVREVALAGASAEPEAASSPRPVLRVVQGERKDEPPAPRAAAPPPRRRWILAATGAATLAAAVSLFLMIPRSGTVVSLRLPAPVRDTTALELSPPATAREVRLEPETAPGVTANGARLRRLDGGWLTIRVEAGPPLAVVVARSDLSPGRYQLELVWATPEGREESRGFYRFTVKP